MRDCHFLFIWYMYVGTHTQNWPPRSFSSGRDLGITAKASCKTDGKLIIRREGRERQRHYHPKRRDITPHEREFPACTGYKATYTYFVGIQQSCGVKTSYMKNSYGADNVLECHKAGLQVYKNSACC